MSEKKYCYEFTEHRQYKCCECGRTMHEPKPHICNGQYRKHKMKFFKGDYKEYASLKFAGKDLGVHARTIRQKILGLQPSIKLIGYKFTRFFRRKPICFSNGMNPSI